MYYPPEVWDYNGCYALEQVLEETKHTIGVLERVKDEEGTRIKKTRFEEEEGWNLVGKKGKAKESEREGWKGEGKQRYRQERE